jgi:hypothetical protein
MHPNHAMQPLHIYEKRPRTNKRGVDLISDALPFGRVWYGEPEILQPLTQCRDSRFQ